MISTICNSLLSFWCPHSTESSLRERPVSFLSRPSPCLSQCLATVWCAHGRKSLPFGLIYQSPNSVLGQQKSLVSCFISSSETSPRKWFPRSSTPARHCTEGRSPDPFHECRRFSDTPGSQLPQTHRWWCLESGPHSRLALVQFSPRWTWLWPEGHS